VGYSHIWRLADERHARRWRGDEGVAETYGDFKGLGPTISRRHRRLQEGLWGQRLDFYFGDEGDEKKTRALVLGWNGKAMRVAGGATDFRQREQKEATSWDGDGPYLGRRLVPWCGKFLLDGQELLVAKEKSKWEKKEEEEQMDEKEREKWRRALPPPRPTLPVPSVEEWWQL